MGIKQADFAQKMDISRTHLSLIVTGKRQPSIKLAKKILKETDEQVTFNDLFSNHQIS